jgi:hypothetical protein
VALLVAALTALITALSLPGSVAAVPAGASPAGRITISAQFLYVETDEHGNDLGFRSPMRDVTVQLMEDNFGRNAVVATGRTDYTGKISFTVNNDDPGGRDPYLKVFSENGAADCRGPDLVPQTYSLSLAKAGTDVPDGFVHDYGQVWPDARNPAWQSIDAVLEARDWVYANTSPHYRRGNRVGIIWPYAWREDPTSFYVPKLDQILLPKKSASLAAAWTKATVHHEYTHAIMFSLYGLEKLLNMGVTWASHEPPSHTSPGFALFEGWAEYMECAVEDDPGNVWWYGGTNIEANKWYDIEATGRMDGDMVEGSVASIFWDITDGISREDRDVLSLPFNDLFTVMRYDKPQGLHQFWDAWCVRYPDLSTHVGPLSSTYYLYGIDKDHYSPYGLTIAIGGPGSPPPGWTARRNVTLTLGGDDYGCGVSTMRFSDSGSVSDWLPWTAESPNWVAVSPWTLGDHSGPNGDGKKTVSFQLQDLKGHVSAWQSATIMLDSTGPWGSIAVNGGALYTDSPDVALDLHAVDAYEAAGIASGVATMSYGVPLAPVAWVAYAPTKAFTWPAGDGVKTVCVTYGDRLGNVSAPYADTIILDTTPPAGTFRIGFFEAETNHRGVTLASGVTGATQMRFRNEGDTWSAWLPYGPIMGWTLAPGDGAKRVESQYRDPVGHVLTLAGTITLDTRANLRQYRSDQASPIPVAGLTNETMVALSVADVRGERATIMAVGESSNGQGNVGSWTNVTQIAGGGSFTVGLKRDGTVVAVGEHGKGQCDVDGWTNVTQVAGGSEHTVGLRSDGTATAVGDDEFGQGDVGSWENVTQIAAGAMHTVGLRGDGTVVASGDNTAGQCNVGSWTNVTHVAAGAFHTVGLRSDGTVVAVGAAGDGNAGQCDVGSWTNVTQVAAGIAHTVGLRSDGTVVAVGAAGRFDYGQCAVGSWTDITQISAGGAFTLGLKKGGTVVAAGHNEFGQCNVGSWAGVTQIAAGGMHSVALATPPTCAEFEVKPVGSAFTGDGLVSGAVVEQGGTSTAVVSGLTDDGPYKWRARLSDEGGGTYPWTDFAAGGTAFVVDRTPPTGSLLLNNGEAFTNGTSVTVSSTVSDSLGVTEMRFSTDDKSSWGAWLPFAATSALTLPTGDGLKVVWAQYRDSIGNVFESSDDITLDATPPTTTATGLAADATSGWVSGSTTLTLTSVDAGGSGLSRVEYRLDGGGWITYAVPTTLSAAAGSHTIDYRATDLAGNVEALRTGYLNVDATPPVTTDDAPAGWCNSSVVVTLTPTDTGSGMSGGLARTEYKLDADPWTSGISLTISSDGDHTLLYRSRDHAGNLEDVRSVHVKIDSGAPLTTACGADDAWHKSAVTVTFAATDAVAGIAGTEYRIDGGPWTSGLSVTVASDGDHLVGYRSSDNAGNVETEKGLHVRIDTTGPVTSAKATSGKKGRAVKLACMVGDSLSPTAMDVTLVVENARGKSVKTLTVGSCATAIWYSASWTPTAAGTYRYTVYAKDLAGNAQSRAGSAKVTVK